jgi:hypothetical protein
MKLTEEEKTKKRKKQTNKQRNKERKKERKKEKKVSKKEKKKERIIDGLQGLKFGTCTIGKQRLFQLSIITYDRYIYMYHRNVSYCAPQDNVNHVYISARIDFQAVSG